MKRIFTILIMSLVVGLGSVQAQVVDVCAGNDSIVLRLGHFQYGYVQWQVSDDNETWMDIDGAVDTIYKFLPERPQYYRAEVKFPQCSEYNYHSQVSYVQIPPKASAGPDMDVPANVPVRLCASVFEGAEGEWSVIEGTNGTFDDVNAPHSLFIGGEGEYKLVWTLTNSCGTNSDTVNINCVAMEYSSKILIVDETDVILSDTLQLLNGEYAVVFTDTVPEITGGTVLLGYREKPFMRKVTSFEKVGDVFVMQTEQAAISDIILSGAMCFDPIGDLGEIDSTKMRVLERYPTRKEMAADPFLLRDGGVYFVKGKECREDRGISMSIKNGKLTTKISVNLSMFHSSLDGLEFEFIEVAEPNFRADINLRDDGGLTKFYMGFYNEKITKTYKLKASKQVTATGVKLEGYLNPQQLIVGGFMVGLIPTVVTVDFPITGSITASLKGLEVGYTKEWTGTHAIEWRNDGLVVIDTVESVEKTWEPFNITGHLDAKIGLGVKLGIMLVDVLGPTATIKGTFGPELCFSITPPNTLTADLAWGVDLNLACRLQAFSHSVGVEFLAHDFHLFRGSEFAPSRILRVGGDQQVYNPLDISFYQSGGFLPEYIRVNTKGWFGSNMPFALVHFEPEEGGEVSDSPIIANVHGIASVRWKPGTTAGHHKLKAWVYDCDGNAVAGSPLVFHAYTEGTGDCWKSGLTADFVEHVSSNGTKTVELLVTGGDEPYEYSTDATNYYPMLQTVGFTPQPGQSYMYYVRDAYGCETEAYYNEPFYDCHASTLGLNVQIVNGNTIRASALGGFSPYWFSIDDVNFTPGFNGQYSFPNLIDGTYGVTVKDAMGCVQTKTVVVEREANVGLSIVDAGYDLYGNPTGTVQMMASVQTIYDRGLCWCIKTDAGVMPTVYDFRLSYGSGSNDYGFTLQGLDSQKAYYVRAYVLCDAGTAYSNVLEVTPNYLVTKPFVYLTAVSSTTNTSANCSSNVVNDGFSDVTDRGFCWSATNPNPTLADNHVSCGTGTGVFSGMLTGLESNTHYYVCAYATNSQGTGYGLVNQFTTTNQGGGGFYNGHEYVDLGLPSGTLWATCNVGANAPEDYGYYIAWAETQPKSIYNWSTLKYCVNGNSHQLTKYCPFPAYGYNGFIDNLTNLLPEDDAATANWGEGWRTPSEDEWLELWRNTTTTYTAHTAIHMGPNGNFIYLPAAGMKENGILYGAGKHGLYWSNALGSTPDNPRPFAFISDGNMNREVIQRPCGYSVRAVRSKANGVFPIVTTSEVTDYTTSTAVCYGEVISDGGTMVVDYGVCWSTVERPTLFNNHVSVGNGVGTFAVNITGLSPGTRYYVRAYATNAEGTSYGKQVVLTTLSGGDLPEGAINGRFSVSPTRQVYFSQGNLQYQASTNTWRFAENQWDYVGETNSNISPTYDGWIDLFGWGTSGWNNGNDYFMPYDCLFNDNGDIGYGYGPTDGQHYNLDLSGLYAHSDWGVHNAISNGGNIAGQWRVLTSNEWDYVINKRATGSGIRYAKATVNGIKGLLLLPDNWDATFYSLNSVNLEDALFSDNVITSSVWANTLQASGCVFFPASGWRRSITEYTNAVTMGTYWGSTHTSSDLSDSDCANGLFFSKNSVLALPNTRMSYKNAGCSVRLVCDVE